MDLSLPLSAGYREVLQLILHKVSQKTKQNRDRFFNCWPLPCNHEIQQTTFQSSLVQSSLVQSSLVYSSLLAPLFKALSFSLLLQKKKFCMQINKLIFTKHSLYARSHSKSLILYHSLKVGYDYYLHFADQKTKTLKKIS